MHNYCMCVYLYKMYYYTFYIMYVYDIHILYYYSIYYYINKPNKINDKFMLINKIIIII